MEDLKFTKEIKQAWLDALKSGKYIQGTGKLMDTIENQKEHCCLGVLCEVHPSLGLDLSDDGKYAISEVYDGMTFNNYGALMMLLPMSSDDFYHLYDTNDCNADKKYTAVIPLIEKIPTQDDNNDFKPF